MELLYEKLRQVRKEKGITIKALSKLSGVSIGMISAVERGHVNPSVDVVLRLCSSLGIDFNNILHSEGLKEEIVITRKDDHYCIMDHEGTSYLVSPLFNKAKCAVLLCYLNPGGRIGRGHISPDTYELIVVVDGSAFFVYGDREFTLKKGDSVYFRASQLHFVKNVSDKMAILVWLVFTDTRIA